MTWKETEFISLSINTATRLVAPIFHRVSCAELWTAAVGLILGLADGGAPRALLHFFFQGSVSQSQHLPGPHGAVPAMSWPPHSSPHVDLDAAQHSEVTKLSPLGPSRPTVTNCHPVGLQAALAQLPRLA